MDQSSNVIKEGRLLLSGCLIIRESSEIKKNSPEENNKQNKKKENKENKETRENKNKELLLLYRTKHKHYETPGGKMELSECSNPPNVSIDDLKKTAERELAEEIGEDFKYTPLEYFGSVEFSTPDGRLAVANKFITKIISGSPKIAEPALFSKLEYLPIKELDKYPISPDLKLLFPKLISL